MLKIGVPGEGLEIAQSTANTVKFSRGVVVCPFFLGEGTIYIYIVRAQPARTRSANPLSFQTAPRCIAASQALALRSSIQRLAACTWDSIHRNSECSPACHAAAFEEEPARSASVCGSCHVNMHACCSPARLAILGELKPIDMSFCVC